MTRIISIDGNIGSGKSTFIENLKNFYSHKPNCKNLFISFLPEPVDQWNTITDLEGKTILQCYYSNPDKYAFAFQMMAYISRLSSLKSELKKEIDFIFTERCIFTDYNVFCKMLYDDKKINEIEYKIYCKWFNEFIEDFPNVEYVYIKTNPEIALNRVKSRNRKGEDIPLEYLERCHSYHEKWLQNNFNKIEIDGNININIEKEKISEWIKLIDNYIQFYEINISGVCRGYEKHCGINFMISLNKKKIFEENTFVEEAKTTDVANYTALKLALKKCSEFNIKNIIVLTDSHVLINDMNNIDISTNEPLIELKKNIIDEIINLNEIKFLLISPKKNSEMIKKANLAINRWGKKPSIYTQLNDLKVE